MSGTWVEAEVTQVAEGHRPQPSRTLTDPYVVSVPEAAALLGISKDLAYDLAVAVNFPALSNWGDAGGSASLSLAPPFTGPRTALPSLSASSLSRASRAWHIPAASVTGRRARGVRPRSGRPSRRRWLRWRRSGGARENG